MSDNGINIQIVASHRDGYWELRSNISVSAYVWDEYVPLYAGLSTRTAVPYGESIALTLKAEGDPVCFIRPLFSLRPQDPRDPEGPTMYKADVNVRALWTYPCQVSVDVPYRAVTEFVLWNRDSESGYLDGGNLQEFRLSSRDNARQIQVACTGKPAHVFAFVTSQNADILKFARQHVAPTPNYRRAIDADLDEWQRETRTSITSSARSDIIRDVMAHLSPIYVLSAAQSGQLRDPRAMLSTVLHHYCYDLRDSIVFIIPAQGLRLNGPWPLIPVFFGTPPKSEITARDVRRYTFVQLLSRFFVHDRATPVGRLLVSSTPSGATITIDNAFRGYTQRRFVISVGSHVVDIKTDDEGLHCIRPFNVAPDKSISLTCPDLHARRGLPR